MNKKELHERSIDNILYHAVPIAAKELTDEIELPREVEFSEGYLKKKQAVIRRYKNKKRLKLTSKHSKRIAVIFLLLVVISSIGIFGVEAWRITAFNIVMEIMPTNTWFTFKRDNNEAGKYEDEKVFLRYIPENFKLIENLPTNNKINMYFSNRKKWFTFTARRINDEINLESDAQNAVHLQVNNNEAFWVKGQDENILMWYDENFSYVLEGNIAETEIFKIAENAGAVNK